MRVIVADDAMLTREGIAHLLTHAGVDVVAQVADADQLLREVARSTPDVVVVDIQAQSRRAARHVALLHRVVWVLDDGRVALQVSELRVQALRRFGRSGGGRNNARRDGDDDQSVHE